MITLYSFQPAFELPDPSPFVMKAEVLLKMSGLEYQKDTTGNLMKAPKKKLPFIEDNGNLIADSTFIRFHLEENYNINFDRDLSEEYKSKLFFAEKYFEDNVYFLIMSNRWLNKENFEKGPKVFFEKLPPVIKDIIGLKVRSDIKKTLWLQGLGRHSLEERKKLVEQGSHRLAVLLGGNPFFGGDQPCGADATFFSFLTGVLTDFFSCPYREYFSSKDNLVAYKNRMMEMFYS